MELLPIKDRRTGVKPIISKKSHKILQIDKVIRYVDERYRIVLESMGRI